MPTIHITRGIQASGKSEFARRWAAEDPENRIRINRDDLRRMTTGGTQLILDWPQEQHITRLERDIALTSLRRGRDVIIDAMNLRDKWVRPWLSLGYPVEFHDFPVDLDLALARNEARGTPVPEAAIRRAHERFTMDGALNPPPVVVETSIEPYVPKLGMPAAILVDLDGTLAHMDGRRTPDEWGAVGGDRLDEAVASIVREMASTHLVVIMSGRSSVCREQTEQWLRSHNIPYDEVFMRPRNDNRADTVVKRELFNMHVRHQYNVAFAIDDRDSVVRQWRDMGIKTFQAQEGDF